MDVRAALLSTVTTGVGGAALGQEQNRDSTAQAQERRISGNTLGYTSETTLRS